MVKALSFQNAEQEPNRVLRQIVSLEAWYTCFTADTRSIPMQTALSFHKGFFGENPTDQIRFGLQVKSATLEIRPAPMGNISIPRGSVYRPSDDNKVRLTESGSEENSKTALAKGSINATFESLKMGFAVGADAKKSTSKNHTKELETLLPTYSLQHRSDRIDGSTIHSWKIIPNAAETLEGQVMNGMELISLKNTAANLPEVIETIVSVRLKCRVHDLVITGLEYHDPDDRQWKKLDGKQRLELAHGVIRSELSRVRLADSYRPENELKEIIIAEIVAESGEGSS